MRKPSGVLGTDRTDGFGVTDRRYTVGGEFGTLKRSSFEWSEDPCAPRFTGGSEAGDLRARVLGDAADQRVDDAAGAPLRVVQADARAVPVGHHVRHHRVEAALGRQPLRPETGIESVTTNSWPNM